MSDKNIDQLKDALNIDREPFSEDGVAGLFFPGAGRQELLEQLMHLCRYGSPLLFVVGENGVGKSAIVSQLVARIDPAVYRAVYIDADVLADVHFLLAQLADGFSLDLGSNVETAINAVVRFSKELDSYSQTPLLVLDSAQNLSPDAVQFLLTLLSHVGGTGFRCLLIADGESCEQLPLFAGLIGSGVDFQEILVPLLDRAACKEYLSYRMTTSGLGAINFNVDQVDQIYNSSMGNIDKINIVARQLLVETFPYNKNKRKPFKVPVLHLSLIILLAALLFASYLYEPDEPAREVVEQSVSLPLLSNPPRDAEMVDAPVVEDAVKLQDEDSLMEPGFVAEEALDSFAEDVVDVDYNFQEAAEAEVLQPIEEEAVSSTESKVDTPLVVAAEKKAKSQAEPDNQALSAKPSSLTHREQWLLSLDKSKYTLQMLGAREEASVQKFLAKYPSLKGIAYYKTIHKQKDWFVVVYGLYPTKEGAKADLTTLPKALRESQPWARSIASVQEEIRLRNN